MTPRREISGRRKKQNPRGRETGKVSIEAAFRAIYDQSSYLGGILSLEGTVLNTNRTACELVGVSPSDVIGRPFWETPWWTHSAAEREKLRDAIRRASRGESVHFQATHAAANGELRYMDISLKPVRDGSGQLFCLISESRDVTEEKRAEEKGREKETMLKGVFRAAPIGITFNVDRVILSVNDSMCELLGYSEAEIVGNSARMFYDSQEEFEKVGRELYDPNSRAGRTGVETRFARKDGTPVFVILSTAMLKTDDPSAGYIVTVQDITARKRAEEALRESEDRFRSMMEQSPFSIQVFSPDGTVLEVNEAFEKLWGVNRESLADYNILQDRQIEALGFMPAVRRAFGGEQASSPVVDYDAGKTVGAGKQKIVQGIFYPVRDADGTISRVILIHLDLTGRVRAEEERNRLQEQLQQAMKMEAVGRLAGGIAHDFNNLLTAITGNAELASMEIAPTDNAAAFLKEISKAAESAASLTNQLLAFSRRQIIEPKVINLNDLIERMQKILARVIGEDVALKTALAGDLGSVRVDPGQFEQVLVNLAVNARDAMPNGGRLLIETADMKLDEAYCAGHPQVEPGDYVMLAMSDTGHGMSDEVKRRIFEPFFTTKPKGRGTGLGLATIFGTVKQAKGSIEIYSEAGLGTTFRIYLPRVEPAPEKSVAETIPMEMARGRETLLLVEDEASVRELARAMLGRLGYLVLQASDGAEALRLAEEHDGRIDLLMTDVVMPGMNGRELAERLQAVHPEMKVLLTSGYTEDVIVHHGVLDGNLSFISKPYSLHSLSAKIREILGRQAP